MAGLLPVVQSSLSIQQNEDVLKSELRQVTQGVLQGFGVIRCLTYLHTWADSYVAEGKNCGLASPGPLCRTDPQEPPGGWTHAFVQLDGQETPFALERQTVS